jgi:hypothetical protein
MNVLGLMQRKRKEIYSTPDDARPVKMVPDGYNSFRIIYAD